MAACTAPDFEIRIKFVKSSLIRNVSIMFGCDGIGLRGKQKNIYIIKFCNYEYFEDYIIFSIRQVRT